MTYRAINIGLITQDLDGSDQFILVTREDGGPMSKGRVLDFVEQVYMTEGQPYPGAYYCHQVEVMRRSETQFVAVIRHRYDV